MFRKLLNTSVLAVAIASVVVPVLVLDPDAANAQSGGRGGADVRGGNSYCPVGTCSKRGTRTAANINNCSAANCRR
jgi:hypothetical protein